VAIKARNERSGHREHRDDAAPGRAGAESTELLQALIRNRCVNDGRPESGEEARNADLLATYLDGPGLELERFEHLPGRSSLVARIEGSDASAPSLCLMGHTDVVPANPAGWREDPFGGELIDGEVWGRGAIDMLNLTATMAVATKELARSGFRPRGTLIYLAVADEEAGGHLGAERLVADHWDAVGCDYLLTESGGWSLAADPGPRRVVVTVAEKGVAWRRLTVSGTPGHGSMPFGTDNALVTAAEVVRRIAALRVEPRLDALWDEFVVSLGVAPELEQALRDPQRLDEALGQLPPALARVADAVSHVTFSPNVAHGGQKTNTIPDEIVLEVDVRTLPGVSADEADAYLTSALGELAGRVRIERLQNEPATGSPSDGPMWDALARNIAALDPGSRLSPGMFTGGTDARFFRLRGTVAYGAGLFVPGTTMQDFAARFHGNDERVDVASLGLTTTLFGGVVRDLLA
jgi:acetylornithine deacetylase/succinyl-diaminopimelate desuccinylase-like protein